jgi:activator of HSP90 ATPase
MSSFQQVVNLPGTPKRVYDALMKAEQHTAFTGSATEMDERVGGAFSCHGGQIVGVNLELVDGQRIVQAWRPGMWPAGVFSVVRYDLEATGDGTCLTLTHSAVPEGAAEMLQSGWHDHYWAKLPGYLAE